MPSLFQETFHDRVRTCQDRAFGIGVVFLRRNSNDGTYTESAEFTATFAAVDYQVIDGDGVMTSIRSRDFMFAAADVVISSVTYSPQVGDRIREAVTGDVHEIMSLPGQPAAELDAPQYRWKVHTKRVKVG